MNKIEIIEQTKEGWCVAVSADITCKFLEFCRSKMDTFTVDVKVVSSSGTPDTDYFWFNAGIQEHCIKDLVKEFIG